MDNQTQRTGVASGRIGPAFTITLYVFDRQNRALVGSFEVPKEQFRQGVDFWRCKGYDVFAACDSADGAVLFSGNAVITANRGGSNA